MNEEIKTFRSIRVLSVLAKNFLGLLDDLRNEHDQRINQTGEALLNMEEFLQSRHNIAIDLAHLTQFFAFFDEEKYKRYRKKVLDLSNDLQREISK